MTLATALWAASFAFADSHTSGRFILPGAPTQGTLDGGYHSAPLKDGLRLPSGDSRHVAVNDGRLYLMTSGSGVFTREIPKAP